MPSENYLFVHFDFNKLPHVTTANFYRLMLENLRLSVAADPDLSQQLSQMIDRNPNWADTFGLYMTLLAAHDLLIQGADFHVIWLLDRFEKGCPELEAETLNSLRSLRDQHKDRVSFIPFTRKPLSRLRNPAEYDEFHEILSMHECYVGSMNERDGQWPARQVEQRYKVSLPPVPVQELYKLCGGLPAFLKVADTALAAGDLDPKHSPQEWHKQLIGIQAFQRFAQEIWDSYEPSEQAAMRSLALHPKEYTLPPEVERYLMQMGILRESYNGDTVEFFSPLFADFVEQQSSHEKGITMRGEEVYRDGMLIQLARQEFALFKYLYEREGTVCERIDIIKHIWPDDGAWDENDERLPALIRRLRARLNPKDSSHQYIENVRGRGYKFVQHPQD
ncbi:MAG: winged helix-turn-helix domain-containing protein [Chloroflexota bacterium]